MLTPITPEDLCQFGSACYFSCERWTIGAQPARKMAEVILALAALLDQQTWIISRSTRDGVKLTSEFLKNGDHCFKLTQFARNPAWERLHGAASSFFGVYAFASKHSDRLNNLNGTAAALFNAIAAKTGRARIVTCVGFITNCGIGTTAKVATILFLVIEAGTIARSIDRERANQQTKWKVGDFALKAISITVSMCPLPEGVKSGVNLVSAIVSVVATAQTAA